MSTEETSSPKDQTPKILIITIIAVSILLCCCVVGLILFLSTRQALNLLATPTPLSLKEINSGTGLGKFYFGLDGVDDTCHVIRQTDKFSQEDILRSEYVYFSIPFTTQDEGQEVQWDIYDLQGQSILDGNKQPVTLTSSQNHCLTGYLGIDPRTKPGDYILEVKHENQMAYREVFAISASDLDKIPRTTRKPFGDITVGRNIDIDKCVADHQSSLNTYSLTDLKDAPWFYIVSPFQLSDIDKKIYWSVRNADGKNIFYIKRVIHDKLDLCFWQGFSMEDSPAGKYTVVIQDDRFKILYQTDFELK